MVIDAFPDWTGDGVVHTLAQVEVLAGATPPANRPVVKWIQVTVIAGSGTGRLGSASVSATRGLPFGPSFGGSFSPAIAEYTSMYPLTGIYIYVPATMTVSISFGL